MADGDTLEAAVLGTLDTYERGGTAFADCPNCGQQGRVMKRAGGLVMFECYGQCGGGSGVYRASGAEQPSGTEAVRLTAAATVQPEPVVWTWDGRVPSRAVTLLVGRQGLGKTTALVEVIARLTKGELPGAHVGTPVTCLIATAEDALATTLVPRLLAAEADMHRVHFVTVERDGMPDTLTIPDDLPELAARAASVGARFLAIDPFVAFLPPNVNAWRDQDVRRAIAPMGRMAEDCDMAVVPVVHLRKDKAEDVLSQVAGSIGFTAAARSVLLLAADPDDADGPTRVLAHAKSNLGPLASSLGCRVETVAVDGKGGTPMITSRLLFTGVRDVTAEDLRAVPDRTPPSALDEATDFLLEELGQGRKGWQELVRRAAPLDMADITLRRARDKLRKEGRVRKGKDGDGPWYWELVGEAAAQVAHVAPPIAQLEQVEQVEQVRGEVAQLAHVAEPGGDGQVPTTNGWTSEAADAFMQKAKVVFPGSYEVDEHGEPLP